MTQDEKLDKIIGLLELVIEGQQEQQEQNLELREAVADLGLPGSGYSTFSADDEG